MTTPVGEPEQLAQKYGKPEDRFVLAAAIRNLIVKERADAILGTLTAAEKGERA